MNEDQKIGRYEIRRKIGAGGMGEVYLAHDRQLNRKVALKILPKQFSEDDLLRHRFRQEARAVSALNHPNIITIYEIGESEAGWFIATEYIEGETLRHYLKESPLRILQAVRFAEQIAQALVAAHSAGIIHRDIKPENIMIRRDGYVKVLDFGLAKPTGEASDSDNSENNTSQIVHTIPGMVMGSVRYMSPEQARGLAVDARTDIWSLGVVLFEMLTGQAPFRGETTSDTLAAVIHLEPAPLVRLAPNASAELERIVRKALQKQAGERYQSVKDLALDLKNLLYDIEHEISLENQKQIRSNPSSAGNIDITENPTMIHHTSGANLNTSGANHPTHVSAAVSTEAGAGQVSISATRNKNFRKQTIFASVIVLAVIAAAIFGYRYWFMGKENGVATFEKTQVTRLETDGKVRLTAISSDGKYIAYAAGETGNRTLVVRQISTDSTVTLVPPTPLDFVSVAFSNTGDYVYYTQIRNDFSINTLYRIPTLGGEPKKLVEDVDSAPTFSPDGKKLAFRRNESNDNSQTIFVANLDGSDLQALINTKQTEFGFFSRPIWSPGGEKFLVAASKALNGLNNEFFLAEISIADKSVKPIGTKKWKSLDSYGWLKDGSGIVLAGQETEESYTQIWRMSYPDDGQMQAITNDTNNYYDLSLSGNADTIGVVKAENSFSLWNFNPVTKEQVQLVSERRNLFWDTRLSQLPDGKLLFSRREGKDVNIWQVNADGTNERRLLEDAKAYSNPVASPDGRFIVFASKKSGDSRIWRVNADGTNAIQVTEADSKQSHYNPQILADGKTIVFQVNQAEIDKNSLSKVSIDGGQIEPLLNEDSTSYMIARFSPDGKQIAVVTFDRNSFDRHLLIADFDGTAVRGVKKKITYSLINNFSWSPDSKSVTYLSIDGVPNLWKLPLNNDKPEAITDFKAGRIFSFAWSRDGKSIYLVRGSFNNDLILIRDVTR